VHVPIAGEPVQFIAIRRRLQSVEMPKRALRAAQHYGGRLFTRNLAKPGSVTDLLVTDGAFVLRDIRV
jgi:hypothetical protein